MLKLGHNVEAGNKITLLCICLDALSIYCPSRSLLILPIPFFVYLCICVFASSLFIPLFVYFYNWVSVYLYICLVSLYIYCLSLQILPIPLLAFCANTRHIDNTGKSSFLAIAQDSDALMSSYHIAFLFSPCIRYSYRFCNGFVAQKYDFDPGHPTNVLQLHISIVNLNI